MEKNAVLDDGSSLVADGTILRKNGQVFILDEGDAIRIDGVIEPAGLGSDQVGMKYGIMWTMVNGKSLLLEKDLTLANGITVMVDGTVIMKDKTTLKIQEGQTLTPDGKIGNGALQVDHITLKGGKVWARKNGETMMQEGNFTLDNGTRIAPNGIVSLPDGKSATLAEGDVVLPTGQIVRSGPTSAVPD